MKPREVLKRLERMGVITTSEREKGYCCGQMRDGYGRCTHREWHAIYVEVDE